jgi:hypothetical protein
MTILGDISGETMMTMPPISSDPISFEKTMLEEGGSLEQWALNTHPDKFVYKSDTHVYVFDNEDEACNLVMKLGTSLTPVLIPFSLPRPAGGSRLWDVLYDEHRNKSYESLTPEKCQQRQEESRQRASRDEGEGTRPGLTLPWPPPEQVDAVAADILDRLAAHPTALRHHVLAELVVGFLVGTLYNNESGEAFDAVLNTRLRAAARQGSPLWQVAQVAR